MTDKLPKFEWATTRGEKWRDNLPEMEAMLAEVDPPLIAALNLDAPYKIADIGCGGGGTTIEIIRRSPEGSIVAGFDISPALIKAADNRPEAAWRNISFSIADVTTAAPPKSLYQRLISRFGVMFYADPDCAFKNLYNWLDFDRRFAFAVWGDPDDNPWMSSMREIVSNYVNLPVLNPDAPGPFRYADSEKFVSVLTKAGFRDIEVTSWCGLLPIGGKLSAPQAAEFALASFSIGERLLTAGPKAVGNARQRLAELFSKYDHDGAVRMDAYVHIVTGYRRNRN